MPKVFSGGGREDRYRHQRDVEAELRWDPEIDAADIAVTMKDGVVPLGGFVLNYSDKELAEAAAKRVKGVIGVANDIEVRIRGDDQAGSRHRP